VINFLKKFLRYNRQANVTGNKLGKKGAFSTPKNYMEDAMGKTITFQKQEIIENPPSRWQHDNAYWVHN
jgi:hypothetical protein